ncbi:hypothetical protein OF376_02560 [Ureaplasma miroungigenitalium]|uniref:Polymerase/histidinol phosphatase N-terminal domain-containing protein n=1 Tax=Ureaplasma miroungigenitalium TaxID=1042321 RepID=A0ABT3BN31_9BACT|nr:hypothetical protein [Ureaplasma miroungigenitalium]MCV3728644.1 hypothetical protein [Ureaplasma miroungigenitalium]MCV3734335.1 hypothetical protein [Ureaplasma miroungigenitalium]
MLKIKIDLHTHTVDSNKYGSNVSKSSDDDIFYKLKTNNVKIVCFSDHLNFDKNQYLKRASLGLEFKPEIIVWPGIEIDIYLHDKNTRAQVIVVFNPSHDLAALEKFCQTNFNPDFNPLNFDKHSYAELISLLTKEQYDFLIFPHVGKGVDFVYPTDIENQRVDGLDSIKPDHKNVLKMRKHGIQAPVVCFSDTHDWENYPQHSYYWTWLTTESLAFNDVKQSILQHQITLKKCV